jgi:DNA replication protein DnaC
MRARIKIFTALNLVYDEWPNFLGSRPMVEALLSRLRHYCHTVAIDGPSLRELQG